MYNIIKRYCESPEQNGLLLLDMPTGSGKTYSVMKYICDAINSGNEHRFFFITTLKKNLPQTELKTMFESLQSADLFEDKFIQVDSNSESAIEGFSKDLYIPYDIKKTEEYRKYEQYIKTIQGLRDKTRNKKEYDLKNILSTTEDKFRTDIEPKFRFFIQNQLAKNFDTTKDRIYAIKTQKEWQWVAKLYPQVFISERQIIFMSMDKFLSQNSTLVEPSSMLYNSKLINNSIVFIDEFDATKETILNNIIQNGLKDRVDYLELFQDIYAALNTHRFPTKLTTPSQKRLESNYKNVSLQSVIDGIIEKAENIHKTYSLQFSHKTDTITDENVNNFLFQDHQFHSVLNGNKSYIVTKSDRNGQINTIQFSDNKPENAENNIQVLLGKLRGFISWFMGGVNILAINYQQCKAEYRKPNEDEFTMEAAIRTVLSEFGLSSQYINFLTSQILIKSHKIKDNIQDNDFDISFYEHGFRYYAFLDDYSHDMKSKIMMYSFQTTPEKLLLRFCEKAKVLGISATATVPTVIGNYDLDYIKEKLQDKFISITDVEKQRLENEFNESISGYDKVNIHTEFVGNGDYSEKSWEQIVDDKEIVKYLYDLVCRNLPDDKNTYNQERYFRIAFAFKKFLTISDIRSFLCVLTKHPRKGDKQLDIDVLNNIFKIIGDCYAKGKNVLNYIVQLDGEEYDSKKDEIIKRLSNGEKLFVISVYQTIGAGQNIHYPVPVKLREKLIKINERESRNEKDFDAIYLEKPTHVLVQLGSNLSEDSFVKYIYQLEMLQEKAEVSVRDTIKNIKRAFRCFNTGNAVNNDFTNIYDRRSVALVSTRLIIQAIGRICRTNLKSNNIYIFADSRISESLDTEIINGRMFNREFTELVKNVTKSKNDIKYSSLEDKASLTSIKVNKSINSMLKEDWTDDRVEKWKKLREMVLCHPTLSKKDFDKEGIAYNFYVEQENENNKIFYTEEADFNNIKVFFNQNVSGCKYVSEEAAKLPSLMKINILRKHFEKHNWATSFEKNKYIMSPPLFKNIYKGAIGEVVGRAILHICLKIDLEEIDDNDLFELFDYKVENQPIYVDFKNWHESSTFSDDELTEKIVSKAKKCEARCVIIANIMASPDFKIRHKRKEDIEIVIIPALLIDGDKPEINRVAIEEIGRCISEYSN